MGFWDKVGDGIGAVINTFDSDHDGALSPKSISNALDKTAGAALRGTINTFDKDMDGVGVPLVKGVKTVASRVGGVTRLQTIDNALDKLRDKVTPQPGSVIYCKLVGDQAEHSGIYVAENEIVHLNGDGKVEIVDVKGFLSGTKKMIGFEGYEIWVSCKSDTFGVGAISVGSYSVRDRALEMVGTKRSYSLLSDNCHQFSSGCLTGEFENSDNYLYRLKNTAEDVIDSNCYRLWDLTRL